MDREAAARAVEDLLRALGHEPVGPLGDTGRLVADAWAEELLDGYGVDAGAVLREGSFPLEAAAAELVVLRALDVTIMCPHHLLPAHGKATVAYLPEVRVAGLGTVAHALHARAHRLALQEQVGAEVAALLVEHLGARGALCQLRLTHTCLLARGARQSQASVETVAFAGSFTVPGPDRDLALATLGPIATGSRGSLDEGSSS